MAGADMTVGIPNGAPAVQDYWGTGMTTPPTVRAFFFLLLKYS